MVIKNKSAIKRIKVADRNRMQNLFYKSSVKTLMKKYFSLIKQGKEDVDKDVLSTYISQIYSKIDKATKKGVFHKNTAARKKSLIARTFKTLD
uniref:ribosomal protein S20 n=1 Tax=Sahlingia subintegra TaxID=468936 RepID=UPI001FCE1A33|nr:ribosomal protein S20 [Sahlingia subintegra]UNJ17378.1 ribosomal protein S20 [Sahlingia subintegra]